jgi:glucan phosphoethanolaminetransferase (alkaline phosphatase superfamily)
MQIKHSAKELTVVIVLIIIIFLVIIVVIIIVFIFLLLIVILFNLLLLIVLIFLLIAVLVTKRDICACCGEMNELDEKKRCHRIIVENPSNLSPSSSSSSIIKHKNKSSRLLEPTMAKPTKQKSKPSLTVIIVVVLFIVYE